MTGKIWKFPEEHVLGEITKAIRRLHDGTGYGRVLLEVYMENHCISEARCTVSETYRFNGQRLKMDNKNVNSH